MQQYSEQSVLPNLNEKSILVHSQPRYIKLNNHLVIFFYNYCMKDFKKIIDNVVSASQIDELPSEIQPARIFT